MISERTDKAIYGAIFGMTIAILKYDGDLVFILCVTIGCAILWSMFGPSMPFGSSTTPKEESEEDLPANDEPNYSRDLQAQDYASFLETGKSINGAIWNEPSEPDAVYFTGHVADGPILDNIPSERRAPFLYRLAFEIVLVSTLDRVGSSRRRAEVSSAISYRPKPHLFFCGHGNVSPSDPFSILTILPVESRIGQGRVSKNHFRREWSVVRETLDERDTQNLEEFRACLRQFLDELKEKELPTFAETLERLETLPAGNSGTCYPSPPEETTKKPRRIGMYGELFVEGVRGYRQALLD